MKTQAKTKTLMGYDLPQSWECMGSFGPDGFAYSGPGGIRVIETRGEHEGHTWLHVSLSYRLRLPTYGDMIEVKRIFVGDEREAYQIFPRRERHVSIHDYCLHLWCCLDAQLLPDFGRYGTI